MNNVVAVDIGYGHCKGATRTASGELLLHSFPSFSTLATSSSATAGLSQLSSLDILQVQVNNLQFVVGKDSTHFLSHNLPRSRGEDFSMSEQYLALLKGMLWYLGHETIDLLVVGLPLNTARAFSAPLQKRLVGTHAVPNFRMGSRTSGSDDLMVKIKQVMVVGQPIGALTDALAYRPSLSKTAAIVLDMGFNTLDMLGMSDGKPQPQQAHAFTGGVASYIDEVSKSVTEWVRQTNPSIRTEFRISSHLYEKALRDRTPLKTSLGDIDLEPHRWSAEALLDQYMDLVDQQLGNQAEINLAVLAGGGARLIEPAFRRKFPLIKNIIISTDPQFSIVKGFLMLGHSVVTRPASMHANA